MVLPSRVLDGYKERTVDFPVKDRRGESMRATWLGKLIVLQDLWYSVLFYHTQDIHKKFLLQPIN